MIQACISPFVVYFLTTFSFNTGIIVSVYTVNMDIFRFFYMYLLDTVSSISYKYISYKYISQKFIEHIWSSEGMSVFLS